MTNTKFGKAMRKAMAAEFYESQNDADRKMAMLKEFSALMGAAVTFAFDGNVPAMREFVKSSNSLIEASAMNALDGYLRLGKQLN